MGINEGTPCRPLCQTLKRRVSVRQNGPIEKEQAALDSARLRKLKIGQPYPYQSIIGTEFVGEILAEKQMKDRVAIIPAVTGRAHIIGLQKFVIDEEDPFKYGFGLMKSAS